MPSKGGHGQVHVGIDQISYKSGYIYFGNGVGDVREKVEGQQFTRGVENTNMTDCIFSL